MVLGRIEGSADTTAVLTYDSPLGRALLGRRVDDQVGYTAPAGTSKVRVVSVETPTVT